jgi:hypothetical protein
MPRLYRTSAGTETSRAAARDAPRLAGGADGIHRRQLFLQQSAHSGLSVVPVTAETRSYRRCSPIRPKDCDAQGPQACGSIGNLAISSIFFTPGVFCDVGRFFFAGFSGT